MTQDERWSAKYKEVVEFINTCHRTPSRHRIEEHDMLNWLKANRKVMNVGRESSALRKAVSFMRAIQAEEPV